MKMRMYTGVRFQTANVGPTGRIFHLTKITPTQPWLSSKLESTTRVGKSQIRGRA